jgi:hypothetical protein
MVTVLSGCSAISGLMDDFDHQAYVQSTLDVSYKGIVEEYAKLTDSAKGEVTKLYDDRIKSITAAYIPNLENSIDNSFSEQQKDEINKIITNLYKSVSYETHKAEEVDENTYQVTINTKVLTSMAAFNTALDSYIKDFNQKAAAGQLEGMEGKDLETLAKQMNEMYTQGIVDLFKETINEPQYGKEKTITVDVKRDEEKNMWVINEKDMANLEAALIEL